MRPKLVVGKTVQEFLSELVRGKAVLDVGCVDDTLDSESTETWMHKHLARTAGSIVGLDILEAEVRELQGRGYNVVCGDATSACLGQEFDYIVAGEVIEHIANPAGLLRNLARHLAPEGRLAITTPHVFFLQHYIEFLLSIQRRRWHPGHVAWYCPFTLENLLQQNGFEAEALYLFTRSRKLRRLLRVIPLRFDFFGSTIVVVARLARGGL